MEPLRIAAHNGAPVFGGAEIATAQLLRGFQDRGHTVRLFYNREVVAEGVAEYGIPVQRAPLGGDLAVHDAVRLACRLRRFDPDILVVGTFRKLWLAALAGRLAGVPMVARIGLETDVPRNAKYRWVYNRWVDAVVTNANDLAEAYRDALPSAPPPRIVTVHKGIVPPASVRPARDVRASLGVDPDVPLIGGVARLVEQKRLDRLVRVVAQLPARVHAVIVGDGVERPALEAQVAELELGDRVRFAGHRDDVFDVMAALDLLVITSESESLANVMLEAMAVGTPVVSTPVSGAREALVAPLAGPGDLPAAGVVVPPDEAEIAAAVESILDDPERRRALGEAARLRVKRGFGPERMLDAWIDVLREAAS